MNPPPLPRRNPIASFFVGLWDVMNFTRRLILNLVFFGLLFLVLIVMMVAMGKGASSAKILQDRTTLVIAPEGRLVEQYSTDPVSRALAKAVGDSNAEEIQLRDLIRAIEAARDDKKIERVVLELDKLQPSGFALFWSVTTIDRPSTSDSRMNSWRTSSHFCPTAVRKRIASNHSASVSFVSRANACRCRVSDTISACIRGSGVEARRAITSAVIGCSTIALRPASPAPTSLAAVIDTTRPNANHAHTAPTSAHT